MPELRLLGGPYHHFAYLLPPFLEESLSLMRD